MNGLSKPLADDGKTERRRFGDYEILSEVARGGMGIVYRARHRNLPRTVALKTVLEGRAASPVDRERFRREVEATARLHHPNIVPVYEVGEQDGCCFYTMQWIEGGNLLGRIDALRNDATTAVRLVEQAARAVHFAHRHGILHRDLKPDNILIDDQGRPLIADFGLALFLDEPSHLTQTNAGLGTPGYMAPEQIRADRTLTAAADIYSLGAILHACLAGQPPLAAASPAHALHSAFELDPPSPRSLNRRVDRDLDAICRKALERDPARRYASAADLADDLARWLKHEPISARPPSSARRVAKWARRHPMGVSLAIAAGVIVVAGAIQLQVTTSAQSKERQATDHADALLYRTQLAFVEREWSAAQLGGARDALLRCAESRRGWEWNYARNLCLVTPANELGTYDAPLVGGGFSRPGPHAAGRPAAARIGAVDATGSAWVWDDRGLELARFQVDARHVAPQAALSPKGDLIAISSRKHVELFDVAARRKLWEQELPSTPQSLAFSFAGDRLGVLSFEAEADRGDAQFSLLTAAGRFAASISLRATNDPRRRWFTFTSDHRLLLSPQPRDNRDSRDPPIQVHNAQTGARLPDLPIAPLSRSDARDKQTQAAPSPAAPVGISPDGRLLVYHVALNDPRLLIRRIDGETNVQIPIDSGTPFGFSFSPDGRWFAYITQDMNLDVSELQLRAGPPKFSSPRGRVLDRQSWILTIHLVDTATGREINTLRGVPGNVLRLAFSPDGRRLLGLGGAAKNPLRGVPESFGVALVWDIHERQRSRVIHASDSAIQAVVVSRDGKRIVTGGDDRIVRVWDAESGRLLRELAGHTSAVIRLSVAENPRKFVSTSQKETIEWDGESGESRNIPQATSTPPAGAAQSEAAQSGAMSPDGSRRATGGEAGGGVKLWSTATGEEVHTLRGHTGVVTSLAFSPDGVRLVTADSQGFMRIWEAP